jgi:hypothetical protein
MKMRRYQILIVFLGLIGIIVFSSCQKSYTCECVSHDSTGRTTNETTTIIIHDTKAKATEICQQYDAENNNIKITCHLE